MAPSRRSVLRRSLGVAALVPLVTLAGCASDDTPADAPTGSHTDRTTPSPETPRASTTVPTGRPAVAYDDLSVYERETFDRALAADGHTEAYHQVGRFDERTLVRHEDTVYAVVAADTGRNEAEYRLTAGQVSPTLDDETVRFEDLSPEGRTAVEAAIEDEYVAETMPNVSAEYVGYEGETYALSVTVADRRIWILTVTPVA